MLTPKKKIARKELKQDTLMTTVAQAEGFYYENRRYVHYAITAVVIAAIGLVIYFNNQRSNNEKAGIELARVTGMMDAGGDDQAVLRSAIDGVPEKGIMGLRMIVDNYGGTDGGEIARFYLAGLYYRLGEFDKALEAYEDFSSGERSLDAGAKAGAGASLEALGRYQEAGDRFEAALGADPEGIAAPEHLYSAARCYGLAGKKDEALKLLHRLKDEYPKSVSARDADRAISRFSI